MSSLREIPDDKTMTIGELIRELQKYSIDLEIWTEGCDCIGNVSSVSLQSDGSVLIERNN